MSKSDSYKTALKIEKIEFYIKSDSINKDLLGEVKRINFDLISEKIKRENFLWNAALISYLLSDYNKARYYIKNYEINSKDSSLVFFILSSLIVHRHDPEKLTSLISEAKRKDSVLGPLLCLNKMDEEIILKGKKIMLFSSYVVPGSGTVMAGKPMKGITSLALTGSLGLGTYFLARAGLYINAIFVSFPWFYKFYFGQIRLTKKIISEKQKIKIEKETSCCEKTLKDILDKYPINFR